VYANVSLEKLTFTFVNISLEWSPFYYYSHSCKFNDPWTNDSPHFPSFVFFLLFFFFFFWKVHIWMNEWMHEFLRRCTYEYMIFFNAYIVYVWKIYFWQKKCFYECIIFFIAYMMCVWMIFFFCEKMHLWNLYAYVMYVWMMFFILWKNAFMKF